MIEAIIGVIFLTFMLGKQDGKWGCFIAICVFFMLAYVIGGIK